MVACEIPSTDEILARLAAAADQASRCQQTRRAVNEACSLPQTRGTAPARWLVSHVLQQHESIPTLEELAEWDRDDAAAGLVLIVAMLGRPLTVSGSQLMAILILILNPIAVRLLKEV